MTKLPVSKNPISTTYSINHERFLKPRIQADPKLAWMMKHLAMSLMYVALRTRRDRLFAASFFAGINCPTNEDIESVKRAITFLFNTIELKQHFYRAGEMFMTLIGDASHNLFADGRGQGCAIVFADQCSCY